MASYSQVGYGFWWNNQNVTKQYTTLIHHLRSFVEAVTANKQINGLKFEQHQSVSNFNFQIHFTSLTSLVLIHFLIHLSTNLSHHPRSHHPSLPHYFTPGSKSTFSTNPSHLRLLFRVTTLQTMWNSLMVCGTPLRNSACKVLLISSPYWY